MRVVLVVFLTLLCALFALANGSDLFARVTYLLIGLLVAGGIWALLSLSGVTVRMPAGTTLTTVGQDAAIPLTVQNSHPIPKQWLELQVQSTLPVAPVPHVVHLAAGMGVNVPLSFPCIQRGRYTVGPITASSSDPFGLFQRKRQFPGRHNVLVYPGTVALPDFVLPPAELPGEGRHRRRTHFITPDASGVREYVFGDSYNRIHWPSTARNNQLMVKEFELDPASETWLILDMEQRVHAGSGLQSTEEYGVTLAASVAKLYLESSRPLGMLTNGRYLDVHRPERGGHQLVKIMEALALARAEGHISLASLLAAESGRFGRFSTLLVVTPSVEESWVHQLEHLMRKGARVASVFVEPNTFGAVSNPLLVVSALLAAGVQSYSLKRGESVQQAVEAMEDIAAVAQIAMPEGTGQL